MDIKSFLMQLFMNDTYRQRMNAWREQKAQELQRPVPATLGEMMYHDGNVSQGLQDIIRQKRDFINLNTKPVDWLPTDQYNFMRHEKDKYDLLKSRGGV